MVKGTFARVKQLVEKNGIVLVEVHPENRGAFRMYVTKVNEDGAIRGYTEGGCMYFMVSGQKSYGSPGMSSHEWKLHTEYPARLFIIQNKHINRLSFTNEFVKVYRDCSIPGISQNIYSSSVTFDYPAFFCQDLPIPASVKSGIITELQSRSNRWSSCSLPTINLIGSSFKHIYEYRRDVPEIKPSLELNYVTTQIKVGPGSKLKLLGPIYGLDPKGNELLYQYILTVFKGLLPGIQNFHEIDPSQASQIPLIIKAQTIQIQPGEVFCEPWHTETYTSECLYVAHYFCSQSEELNEQPLVFRSRVTPTTSYARTHGLKANADLFIRPGSAVVFCNLLPHKFLSFHNEKSYPITRTVLSFYILRDRHYAVFTGNVQNMRRMLMKVKGLTKYVIEEILSYLYHVRTFREAYNHKHEVDDIQKLSLQVWKHRVGQESTCFEFMDFTKSVILSSNYPYIDSYLDDID
jgi:hypothetical protein